MQCLSDAIASQNLEAKHNIPRDKPGDILMAQNTYDRHPDFIACISLFVGQIFLKYKSISKLEAAIILP